MADTTFTPRRVINIHSHIHLTDDVDAKVATWQAQGAVRTCVLCEAHPAGEPGWGVTGNDDLQPWMERYPDHIIGFGGVNLSDPADDPRVVGELHARGFRGLKLIMPARPYDGDAYMPFYEAAAKHAMPLLFHTGNLSFPEGYRGPCRADHMRPIRLERIARTFPELKVIGAHLGMPWSDEAVRLCLYRPNLYFDFSGGSAAAMHGSLVKQALSPFPGADLTDPDQHLALRLFRDKLLFGTDNPPVERWVRRALDILDALAIPEDLRERFFWRTAAELLGVDVG